MQDNNRYSVLPNSILASLRFIAQSEFENLGFSPCKVTLKTGRVYDRVYLVDHAKYKKTYGKYPEEGGQMRSILIEDVKSVKESPSRLPATMANFLYDHLDKNYRTFRVEFNDGSSQTYKFGHFFDFISYPEGMGQEDVWGAVPDFLQTASIPMKPPDLSWCLYQWPSNPRPNLTCN